MFFTERERNVLMLIAQGATNQEISKHLYVATETVKKDVSIILEKLKAKNRIQAVVFAVRHGLI